MPPARPTAPRIRRARDRRAAGARRRALRLEVGELAAVVSQVGADREHEARDREHECDERGRNEREERAVGEWVAPRVLLGLGPGARREHGERPACKGGLDARALAWSDVEPELRDLRAVRVPSLRRGPRASPDRRAPRRRRFRDPSTTAATSTADLLAPIRRGRLPPMPPASSPSRVVTTAAGGVPSVTCRGRTRAARWFVRT